MPWLVWVVGRIHRCSGCRLCVELCPSGALGLEADAAGEANARVLGFELWPGRCIGCGICADACPERALVMAEDVRSSGPGPAPLRRGLVDLLRAER